MEELLEQLLLKGTLIGSRGLGVHEENSDYDIAIHTNNIPKELIGTQGIDPRGYFSVMPLHNNYLLRIPIGDCNVDVLMYDNLDDYWAVVDAFDKVDYCHSSLLRDKTFRVYAFELALKQTGRFKDTRFVEDICL